MVGGAVMPGKPVANMYFTLYGWQTYTLTLNLLRDLKIGQYTKLPPRVTFTVQMIGGIIVSFSVIVTPTATFTDITISLGRSSQFCHHEIGACCQPSDFA